MIKRTHLDIATLKKFHYNKEQLMAFDKHSENLTRDFVMLEKDLGYRNIARKKVEIFLNGIKTTDT